jgi:predicted TIM-barrel fold metal-dependent hydrolase
MTDVPDIVDAHHHLWDLDRHHYAWLQDQPRLQNFIGDYDAICTNYLVKDLLADARFVSLRKSVHVQAEFDASNPVGETEWLQEQADRSGFPHGIIGFVDLSDFDLQALLVSHSRFANFRGVRQMLNWDTIPGRAFAEHNEFMSSGRWRRGFGLLGSMGLSFDMHIWPHQMLQAAALIAAYPDTMVALNHTGLPIDRDAESMEVWRAGMRALAAQAGVYVKISGLGMLNHDWTTDSIRPIVLEAIDIFGADRCMFASNFPVDKLYADYSTVFRAFSDITDQFTPRERERLFSGNAIKFYRL